MQSNTPHQIGTWTREEMKQMLKKGDYVRLAEITGYTMDYVIKVIDGLRNSDFVLYITRKYLSIREELRLEASYLKELTLLPEKY